MLDTARQERNAIAHGGASDEREWQRRLRTLETDLTDFREIAGGAFRVARGDPLGGSLRVRR
jgi:hypothetical protein